MQVLFALDMLNFVTSFLSVKWSQTLDILGLLRTASWLSAIVLTQFWILYKLVMDTYWKVREHTEHAGRCSLNPASICLLSLWCEQQINISAYILSQLQNNRRESGCVSFLMTVCRLYFLLLCMCELTTSRRTASVTRVSTKLALPRHWPLSKDQSQPYQTQQLPTSMVKSMVRLFYT